ncbi:hypothetical protein OGZ01_01455 [Vibrio harveyi]|nr:hypothetical protein [Vibrio harveyi]
MGENTIISATGSKVTIGANTLIAPNNIIVARQHVISGKDPIKFSGYKNKAITIQKVTVGLVLVVKYYLELRLVKVLL